MAKETTIRIKKPTKKRLEKIGKFNESYDDLINRLIDENEKK